MYMVVENIAITCCPALALLGLLILLTNPLKAGDSSLLRSSLGWRWKQGTGLPGQFPASTSNPLRSAAGAEESEKRVRQQSFLPSRAAASMKRASSHPRLRTPSRERLSRSRPTARCSVCQQCYEPEQPYDLDPSKHQRLVLALRPSTSGSISPGSVSRGLPRVRSWFLVARCEEEADADPL